MFGSLVGSYLAEDTSGNIASRQGVDPGSSLFPDWLLVVFRGLWLLGHPHKAIYFHNFINSVCNPDLSLI